ncbi:MAG TPA: hypothetical protein VJ206_04905 [bacterium]|nr:hypothetical protein [bacterium]
MRMVRLMSPGTRKRGFVVPVPHTRSGQKHVQTYIQTLRPMVDDIAATLDLDRNALAGREPDRIGAAYLGAFLDDLGRRLMSE